MMIQIGRIPIRVRPIELENELISRLSDDFPSLLRGILWLVIAGVNTIYRRRMGRNSMDRMPVAIVSKGRAHGSIRPCAILPPLPDMT